MADFHDGRLTEEQAAERIGCSVGSLRTLRKRGEIGYAKVLNRIYHYPDQIDEYLQNLRVDPCRQPRQTTDQSPATTRDTGSNRSQDGTAASGTEHGTTDQTARSVVSQLVSETFTQPKKPLSGGFLRMSGQGTPPATP